VKNPSTTSWKEVLAHPGRCGHVAQVYQDGDFFLEAVCHYVASGLEQGEGVILVMRESNWAELRLRLEAAGADPSGAIARGQLHIYEAAATLARLMRGGMPDVESFREVIGGALTKTRQKYPRIRAFGEMVDILWQRGHRMAAQHLEEIWNEFIRTREFALFCAYQMDPLADHTYGGPIENVCKTHTHLIPARHYEKLDAAVTEASRQVLDGNLAVALHTLATHPGTGMPRGQATLMWLKENMPRTADKVLQLMRARYNAPDSGGEAVADRA
jgi:hypothetical protein